MLSRTFPYSSLSFKMLEALEAEREVRDLRKLSRKIKLPEGMMPLADVSCSQTG